MKYSKVYSTRRTKGVKLMGVSLSTLPLSVGKYKNTNCEWPKCFQLLLFYQVHEGFFFVVINICDYKADTTSGAFMKLLGSNVPWKSNQDMKKPSDVHVEFC